MCIDKLCHAVDKVCHNADKLCHNADKPGHAAKISPQSKPISQHHSPCATLKYPPFPWPRPDLNRQTSANKGCHAVDQVCHAVDKVCHAVDKVCHLVDIADKLVAQGMQTNFVSRFCRQSLHTQALQVQEILTDNFLRMHVVPMRRSQCLHCVSHKLPVQAWQTWVCDPSTGPACASML